MRGAVFSRRRLVAMVASGAGAIIAAGAGSRSVSAAMMPQAETVFTPYTDPLNRFALSVPEGWVSLRPTVPEIIGAWGAADDAAATFLVIRVPAPLDSGAQGFSEAFLPALRAQPGYTEIGYQIVQVAEQDAPLLDYTLPGGDGTGDPGRLTRVQQVFLARGVEGTILSFRCPYAAAPRYAIPVGTMVGSFTL